MAEVLGVIPAKLGSTRLPRKNILPLGGRPLLAWVAAAVIESGAVDRLVVSTEADEVAEVAVRLGLEVVRRPPELARDPASCDDVAYHALEALEAGGHTFAAVAYFMPTCPFLAAADVAGAIGLWRERRAPVVVSVGRFGHTPFAALALSPAGALSAYFPEHFGKKSQEMPEAWRPNGAVVVRDAEAFRTTRQFWRLSMLGWPMPPERSVDIDEPHDLMAAEAMLAARGA